MAVYALFLRPWIRVGSNDWAGCDALSPTPCLKSTYPSRPKKFVLGCVIPPHGAGARSRNLGIGQTFLAISVYKFQTGAGSISRAKRKRGS